MDDPQATEPSQAGAPLSARSYNLRVALKTTELALRCLDFDLGKHDHSVSPPSDKASVARELQEVGQQLDRVQELLRVQPAPSEESVAEVAFYIRTLVQRLKSQHEQADLSLESQRQYALVMAAHARLSSVSDDHQDAQSWGDAALATFDLVLGHTDQMDEQYPILVLELAKVAAAQAINRAETKDYQQACENLTISLPYLTQAWQLCCHPANERWADSEIADHIARAYSDSLEMHARYLYQAVVEELNIPLTVLKQSTGDSISHSHLCLQIAHEQVCKSLLVNQQADQFEHCGFSDPNERMQHQLVRRCRSMNLQVRILLGLSPYDHEVLGDASLVVQELVLQVRDLLANPDRFSPYVVDELAKNLQALVATLLAAGRIDDALQVGESGIALLTDALRCLPTAQVARPDGISLGVHWGLTAAHVAGQLLEADPCSKDPAYLASKLAMQVLIYQQVEQKNPKIGMPLLAEAHYRHMRALLDAGQTEEAAGAATHCHAKMSIFRQHPGYFSNWTGSVDSASVFREARVVALGVSRHVRTTPKAVAVSTCNASMSDLSHGGGLGLDVAKRPPVRNSANPSLVNASFLSSRTSRT